MTGTPTFSTVSASTYYFYSQLNPVLNADANNTYLHSVNTGIFFVNSGNTGFAPIQALSVTSQNFTFTGQANAALSNDGIVVALHSMGTTASNTINFVNAPNTGYANLLGGSYTNLSDRRFKRDITPYTRGLDTIMALQPVRFVWRADSKKSMGFIAQDVQKVLPEIVTSNKLQGKPTLGVNYSAIIAPLVAAVQEQQREIVGLRAEVKALRQTK